MNSSSTLRVDALSLTLLVVVWMVGTTVTLFALRNLSATARRSYVTGAGLVVVGTSVLAVAGRPWLMACGWLTTSVAVLLLLARSGARGPAIARRAALALVPGDIALIAGVTVLSRGGSSGVVATLFAVAALARAAQLPFPAWLVGTVNAPTPVSALLHAGVVNAGGFLLIRSGDIFLGSTPARWLVGISTFATIVTASHGARLRADVKGSLAMSTSAQMGFMLLAIALGAPIAAMAHLVGHAWYKSARFLGAGGEVGRSLQLRRLAPPNAARSARVLRISIALGAPAATLVVAQLLSGASLLHGPDGWVLAAAMTVTAAHLSWAWTARGATAAVCSGVAIAVAVMVSTYLALVTMLEQWWDPAISQGDNGWLTAAVLVLLGLALWGVGRLLATASPGATIRGRLRRYGRADMPTPMVPDTSPSLVPRHTLRLGATRP